MSFEYDFVIAGCINFDKTFLLGFKLDFGTVYVAVKSKYSVKAHSKAKYCVLSKW